MRCPRCHALVPNEAARCPDCRLSKPKRLVTDESKTAGAAKRSAKQKATPHSSQSSRRNQKGGSERSRFDGKRFGITAGILIVTLLAAGAAYLYVLPSFQQEPVEPQTALNAVNKFRQLPSNQTGLSVDEMMMQELEKSRRDGNLRGYQGWTVKPVQGDKTKVLIVFSFDEENNMQQRAEWIADLVKDTFTPQTELAEAVYGKPQG